jgi:hypothetical protein
LAFETRGTFSHRTNGDSVAIKGQGKNQKAGTQGVAVRKWRRAIKEHEEGERENSPWKGTARSVKVTVQCSQHAI